MRTCAAIHTLKQTAISSGTVIFYNYLLWFHPSKYFTINCHCFKMKFVATWLARVNRMLAIYIVSLASNIFLTYHELYPIMRDLQLLITSRGDNYRPSFVPVNPMLKTTYVGNVRKIPSRPRPLSRTICLIIDLVFGSSQSLKSFS